MILLFLFAPSSTKVKTFDHFVGVNGMFIRLKKLENGLPWLNHDKSFNFK
jgi:hypothetical protein